MSESEVLPNACPGPSSAQAGQSEACDGCPNKTICSSEQSAELIAETTRDKQIIGEKMKQIKHKVLILSGKGGVGKSTLTSQLSWTLAKSNDSLEIACLDIDICGPSIPTMFGSKENDTLHSSSYGLTPVYAAPNLAVVSIGYILPSHDASVVWRGPKKNGMIKQFLRDVDWDECVDFLLIDTPPGTSDEHLSIVEYLRDSGLDGAIIVTTPQEMALLDVRKEIEFCKKARIPIIGVVENMAGFVCPSCRHENSIFKPTTGGAASLCAEYGLEFLGSIPLDPNLAQSSDFGVDVISQHPESLAAKSIQEITEKLIKRLN